MPATIHAMRAMSTGSSAGANFRQLHHPFGYSPCPVAHPLQIDIDLDDQEEKPQVHGHGLLHGEKINRDFIDLALGGVDDLCVFQNFAADLDIARSTASSANAPVTSRRRFSSSSPW